MLPLLLATPPPPSRRSTWRSHTLSRADHLVHTTPPHRTYTRILSSVFLRESRTYQLGYALGALLNPWNDAEYELGERVAPRITLCQIDLRSLNIGVGGLPYADTRVQSAFRAAMYQIPLGSSMAQSPADSAEDYTRGHAFDERFDWSASPARSTPGSDSGVREHWGIHRPERAWVARCACRKHGCALAVVAAEAFSARRVTRASLRVWGEEERWRRLARILDGDGSGGEGDVDVGEGRDEDAGLGEGTGDTAPTLLSRKEIAQRVCPCRTADGLDDAGADPLDHLCNQVDDATPSMGDAYSHLPADWAAALDAAPFTIDIPPCSRPPAGLRAPPPAPEIDLAAELTQEELERAMGELQLGSAPGQQDPEGREPLAHQPQRSPAHLSWDDLAVSNAEYEAAARTLLAIDERVTAARAIARAIAFAASTAEAGQGRVALAVSGTRMARLVAVDVNVVALELAPEDVTPGQGEGGGEGGAEATSQAVMNKIRDQQSQATTLPNSRPDSIDTIAAPDTVEAERDEGGDSPTLATAVDLGVLLASPTLFERIPHDLLAPAPGDEGIDAAALLIDTCSSVAELILSAQSSTGMGTPIPLLSPISPVSMTSSGASSWTAGSGPPSSRRSSRRRRRRPKGRGEDEEDDGEEEGHELTRGELVLPPALVPFFSPLGDVPDDTSHQRAHAEATHHDNELWSSIEPRWGTSEQGRPSSDFEHSPSLGLGLSFTAHSSLSPALAHPQPHRPVRPSTPYPSELASYSAQTNPSPQYLAHPNAMPLSLDSPQSPVPIRYRTHAAPTPRSPTPSLVALPASSPASPRPHRLHALPAAYAPPPRPPLGAINLPSSPGQLSLPSTSRVPSRFSSPALAQNISSESASTTPNRGTSRPPSHASTPPTPPSQSSSSSTSLRPTLNPAPASLASSPASPSLFASQSPPVDWRSLLPTSSSPPPSPALIPYPTPPLPPPCTHTPCVRDIAARAQPCHASVQRIYDALAASILALGDRPRSLCLATAPVGAPRGALADEVRSAARTRQRGKGRARAGVEPAAAGVDIDGKVKKSVPVDRDGVGDRKSADLGRLSVNTDRRSRATGEAHLLQPSVIKLTPESGGLPSPTPSPSPSHSSTTSPSQLSALLGWFRQKLPQPKRVPGTPQSAPSSRRPSFTSPVAIPPPVVVPPLVTPATTTVMGVGMASAEQGLWGSSAGAAWRPVGATVKSGKIGRSVKSSRSKSGSKGGKKSGRGTRKGARTSTPAAPIPRPARSLVASLADTPVLTPLSSSQTTSATTTSRSQSSAAQNQAQVRPLPKATRPEPPLDEAFELEDMEHKMPEYEPVLAALEAAGVVVVSVHPAFMDVLIREVAGVYHA